MHQPDHDYDESLHVKDIFAYFGRAYYLSSVFESGVVNGLIQIVFFTKYAKRFKGAHLKEFNRADYETEFDSFLLKQQKKTLGTLINDAKQGVIIEADLAALLDKANERRNFLAHHYFRERAVQFISRRGRDKMLAELEELDKLFQSADQTFSEFLKSKRASSGLSSEHLDRRIKEELHKMREQAKRE